MSTNVTFNNTTYSVPATGELNWGALSNFLIDVGNNGQTTGFQKFAVRTATSSPVTVSASSDCVVITNLTVAGAVAVNLPAGVTKQIFTIVDGKGDAATNNITITPASGNINGAASYVLSVNRGGITIVYDGTQWTVINEFSNINSASGYIARSEIAAGSANHVIINDGSGNLSSEAQLAVTRGGTGTSTSTGTGSVVLSNSPTLVTPALGTPSALVLTNATGLPLTTGVTGTLPIGNGGTGQVTAAAAFDALAPTTTQGDIIYRNASTNTRLAAGTSTQVLHGGTTPSWSAVVLTTDVSGILPSANGGSGVNNAGTFTWGSNNITITTSGVTSLTVPTSGTVATLAGSEPLSNKSIVQPDIQGMKWNNASPAALSGTTFAATDNFTAFEITSGAGPLSTITNGADGRTIMVTNMSSSSITVTNDLSTTDGIVTGTGADMTLASGASILLRYEATGQGSFGNSRWYIVGGSAGSGSGSGEINAVLNPSAATDVTGWTAATNYTRSRDTSNSPLAPITSTAFAMSTTTASSESSTSGVYYSISSLASGLRSKKLKVEFYCTIPATADGVWRLSVYQGTTRLALSTDSSSVTTLPGGFTGKFTAYFDTDNNAAYSVNFTQTTRTNANTLYVTNVIVGPGIQPQGAVVGEWQSYTPTGSGSFNNATYTGKWRRVGDTMHIQTRLSATAQDSSGNRLGFDIPSGYTIDTSKLLSTSGNDMVLGQGLVFDTSTSTSYPCDVVYQSTTQIRLRLHNAASTYANESASTGPDNSTPMTWASGDTAEATFIAPIAEWAGSGTVTNLAQNDVEYAASTSGTWDADATSGQTVYGPSGATISGSLTANRFKTVQFQTPIQDTDQIEIELQLNGTADKWIPVSSSRANHMSWPSVAFGVRLHDIPAANQAQILFTQYMAPGTTYDSTTGAQNWSSSNYSAWRVKKVAGGQAVGFGTVSEFSNGLMPYQHSNLDNAAATRLGLKTYSHGGSYASGLAPTVTLHAGGGTLSSVEIGDFIPYQMQDGTWRCKFNVKVTLSPTSRTFVDLKVVGIFGYNTGTGNGQTIAGVNYTTTTIYGTVPNNNANIFIEIVPSASTSATEWGASGDVKLHAKPTWAY